MQTDTTNTTTNATETTQETTAEQTSTPPTLAKYLDARAQELRAAQERAAEQQRAGTEKRRAQLLEDYRSIVEKGITPGLRAALRLGEPDYAEDIDDTHDDYYTKVEAPFTHQGEEWRIRYWQGDLYLIGPNGYTERLSSEHTEKGWIYNRSLLDVITLYPVWLEQQERQKRELAEYEAQENDIIAAQEGEQQAQASAPIHYTSTEGSNPRTTLLHRGAYVTVWYINYTRPANDINPATWGTVEAWDKRWLLITADNGRQELINWRHVMTVEPRTRPEDAMTKEQREQAEQPQPGDFDSDEVPF